jgi:hypothetical protein
MYDRDDEALTNQLSYVGWGDGELGTGTTIQTTRLHFKPDILPIFYQVMRTVPTTFLYDDDEDGEMEGVDED